MDRHDVNWEGYWIATTTPFKNDGSLDQSALRDGLRLYADIGIQGLLINGTSGEWFSQSVTERQLVAEIAVEELRGTVPIVIGCTTFTARESGVLAKHAEDIGADGVLSTPPPYCVPSPREIVRFFSDLSEYVTLPIMVYNWARGTNVEIDYETAIQLAKIPNVVALKDSTANHDQMIKTLECVVGDVRVFAPFISKQGHAVLTNIGGDGNIDGGPTAASLGVGFYQNVQRANNDAALSIAKEYGDLMTRLIRPDWSGVFGTPQAQYKACMNLMGQPGGYPRLPLLPIDEADTLKRLGDVLASSGLIT